VKRKSNNRADVEGVKGGEQKQGVFLKIKNKQNKSYLAI